MEICYYNLKKIVSKLFYSEDDFEKSILSGLLLDRKQSIVEKEKAYGDNCDNFVRFSFSVSKRDVLVCLENLEKAFGLKN